MPLLLDLVFQIQIESLSFPSGSPNLLGNVKESTYSGHCRQILAVCIFWKLEIGCIFVLELVELHYFEIYFLGSRK